MMSNEKSLTPWLFLLPGLILFSIYVLYPIVRSFWVSFYEWDGMAEPIFVGWGNYIELFDDEVFWVSVQNNIIWLLLFLTSPAIGLAIALFLNQKIRGIRAVKSLFFFPFVLYKASSRKSSISPSNTLSGSVFSRLFIKSFTN